LVTESLLHVGLFSGEILRPVVLSKVLILI